MKPLAVVILSDRRPGHYHLADGVAAAIARRRPVDVRHIDIAKSRVLRGRLLATLQQAGLPAALALHWGYGLSAAALGKPDLVISAGGDTLAANVAAARLTGAANIFCGTLRHFPPEAFSLVVSSYERHAGLPRHVVALKPGSFDPDTLAQGGMRGLPADGIPRLAGLLVGGTSGLFHYTDEEWRRLAGFVEASHREHGTHWIVSTSRRSPALIGDLMAALARDPDGPVARFIDYRTAGPGTLPELLGAVEAVVCTEDSSTMLSEAVCARLPVVGVAPRAHAFKDEEREYREFMQAQGWCRSLGLGDLTPATFLAELGAVHPLRENHLDRLAAQIAEHLPHVFA